MMNYNECLLAEKDKEIAELKAGINKAIKVFEEENNYSTQFWSITKELRELTQTNSEAG